MHVFTHPKKRILLGAALLTAALLFSGCGAKEPAAESVSEETDFVRTEEQEAVPADEYIINYRVSPEDAAYISGLASQSVLHGEKTVPVEAVANPGYRFVKWSDGEKKAQRKAEKLKADTEVYAIFEETSAACPTIYIDTDDGKKVNSDTHTVGFTLSVTGAGKRWELAGATGQIKCRGNASLGWEKKSYTLAFDEKQRLCGLGKGKNRNWVLISNHCDQSLMRNYIAFWLQNRLDGIAWSPECCLCDVYLNGDYRGNYMLIEKVTTSENRINILKRDDTGELDADFLVELDNYASKAGANGVVWFTAKGFPYEIRGEDNLDSARCDYIDQWMTETWVTVTDGNENEVRKVLNVDAAVDSYILAEVTKNIDCGWSSFFLYRTEDGLLNLGPSWDFDLAMGNDGRLDNGDYRKLYAGKNNGFSQQNHWYIELMEHSWFQKLVAARWDELMNSGLFDEMIREIDNVYAVCAESFDHNFEKWPIFGQTINQEPAQIRQLNSSAEHVSYLKEWLTNRIFWLDEEFGSMK